VLGASLFTAQAATRIFLGRRPDLLLVSDAPPFAPFLGPAARVLRGIQYVYWVMDINPDQLVALRAVSERSLITRAWRWLNRQVYRRAQTVVVLDRFMHQRAVKQGASLKTTRILPPWPHDEHLDAPPDEVARFRREHGLDGRFVVMYSGNHAASHPLTTLLDAAEHLQGDDRFVFLFVGGGAGKRDVEARRLRNVRSLEYQPLEKLGATLRAADLHVVTMRDQMVGIVHTCKVYGIMSVGKPFIFFGPPESHVTDLIHESASGWAARHDDVEGAIALIRRAAESPAALVEKGRSGRELVERKLSQEHLRRELCDVLEASAAPKK
jgi:glycosyltransferase involved in cell wall biosynthesis